MKGGKTPIHVQRWCPADYQADEHVRLLYARRDWRVLTFYRTFLDVAFMQGGDLPAEPEALAAVLQMPVADVRKGLDYCLDRLVHEDGGRLYQGRLRREVASELEFRDEQARLGRLGGLKAGKGRPYKEDRGSPTESIGPPSPAPSPAPNAVALAGRQAEAYPPEQRAEQATDATIRSLQLTLGTRLSRLAEHPNSREMVPAWSRKVTSYTDRKGQHVNGVADYRTVFSIDRLEKSIADADAWLEKLDRGVPEDPRPPAAEARR